MVRSACPRDPEVSGKRYIAQQSPDDGCIEAGAFGPCCACGRPDPTVRNLVSLPFEAPAGVGVVWGCKVCGLMPGRGAVAILCDACVEAGRKITQIIGGTRATDKMRLPVPPQDAQVPHYHHMKINGPKG